MNHQTVADGLEQGLAEIPVLDVHTHLCGARLSARGLHDIMLYHMVISDLYAAGCPNGDRLTQFPNWPTQEEGHARVQQALPYLKHIQNTSSWWGVKLILRDLYGWTAPIDESNWRTLDGLIAERSTDQSWARSVLKRLNIERTCAEFARRGEGEGDDILQYSLEWGFFMRTAWNEFDTALYDLERCWGRKPEPPMTIGSGERPKTERTIRTLDDVHAAMNHYLSVIPYDQVISTATGISTDIDYRLPTDDEMAAALKRRDQAGERERDIYAAYICEALLTGLEKRGSEIMFQFSLGAEPLPFETSSRVTQKTLAQVGELMARHPGLRFQALLGSRHANQTLCTMARELPNFSLAGFWWHNFFPGTIRQIIEERLDMLPANKQVGFFSDAYVVEWAYGKMMLVRKQLASVLADRILLGQFTEEEALHFAHAILWQTPKELNGMNPRQGTFK